MQLNSIFFRTFIVVSLLSLVGPGCGWRTGLDLYQDGDIPSRDGGVLDGSGRDGGRDAPLPMACSRDAECSNGLLCDGIETCAAGRCVRGVPFACDDGVGCTLDSCDDGAGCVFEPNDVSCGPGARCDPFAGCIPGGGCRSDADCDDGNVCNGVEFCAPDTGECVGSDPIACPIDPFDCTVESCDPTFGCTSVLDNSLCPPGTLCSRDRGCIRVDCMRDGDCDDGDPCNGRETCSASATCRGGTPLSCDDGVDCTLDRCQSGVGCVSTVGVETCFDGLDNDCNGLVDCEDFVCMSQPACGGCTPISRSEFRCTDGRDDDCDGFTDCADRDCAGNPSCGGCMPVADSEIFCSDGGDDDCDGFVDCVDFDCTTAPECGGCMPVAMREIFCTDGRDDDCDGFVDCGDFDCTGRPGCGCMPTAVRETACRGGVDEDCDGLIDCADPDCRGRPACIGACVPTGMNEIGVAACTNGRDDDCDGRLDCADPDCTPLGAGAECCNGIDDNGDGNVDEVTCFCQSNADCVGVGTFEQVCWLNTFSACIPDCRRYGGNNFCTMFLPDLPTCNRGTGECM